MPRSGSRANANKMSTRRAKGATWPAATRLRASTRRSLPATSAASRNTGELLLDHAAGQGDRSGRERVGPVELMRREQHGRSAGHRLADEAVDEVAALLVETGVGLVEQPELRTAGEHDRERRATALA